MRGVESAVSGYAGGRLSRPGYDDVSTGTTGHAETVRVIFDPRTVRYADLLQIYFSVVADPTQRNRQGPDQGTQYRTALFPVSAAQTQQARAYIQQLGRARQFSTPIVTSIEPLRSFTAAEAYHQGYMAAHPNQPYIVVNDRPKLEGLKRFFPRYYRS
nr:peptide-methionine (S)-S-oxide reductase MsrA [uncultured Sphingomonas sp.]